MTAAQCLKHNWLQLTSMFDKYFKEIDMDILYREEPPAGGNSCHPGLGLIQLSVFELITRILKSPPTFKI